MTDSEQWNFADAKEEFTPERAYTSVCFDRRLVAELETARERLAGIVAQVKQAGDGMLDRPDEPAEADRLRDHIDDLAEQVEAKRRPFVFESIGRRPWRELLAKHPPTEEQKQAYRRVDYNRDTFPAAAIAASCVNPKLTEDDAAWLDEHLHVAEFDRLWAACYSANVSGADGPFRVTSTADRPAGGKRSTQP